VAGSGVRNDAVWGQGVRDFSEPDDNQMPAADGEGPPEGGCSGMTAALALEVKVIRSNTTLYMH
jgi:hypothetical protein